MLRLPVRLSLIGSIVALSLFTPARPAQSQTGLPAWGVVPSPNAGFANGNTLKAVGVISATDVWAAGSWEFSPFIRSQVQHWNGVAWSNVALPAGLAESELFGIAAVAPNDVWLVGGFESTGQALILHWDGASLTQASHPNPGTFNRLYAVAAVSASDIWAVGEFASGGVSRTLTLHWDGTSWTQVRSPTLNGQYTQLNGVAAVAANDVWAVGQAGTRTFTLRWDGTRWNRVASPNQGTTSGLNAVAAVASNDVWAVGESSSGLLTLRWDGARWNRVTVPNPNPGTFSRGLHGVTAVAANDVWAVGFYASGATWLTLALHWDGAAWSIVGSPSPDPSINFFNAVDAAGAGEVWAVGRGGGTLVERWQGSAWEVVPSANQGTADNELLGLSVISTNDIWAVGNADGDSLTEHWDGSSWSVVPSPNGDFGIELHDVDGLAANDVWAVGNTGSSSFIDFDTATLHWDGSAWTRVTSPNGNPASYNDLDAVAMVASNDVWAVGQFLGTDNFTHPLILHWDGAAWSQVAHNCGTSGSLTGLAVISPTDIWAVGSALTCHYDGASWNSVPSPQPRPPFQELSYSLLDVSGVASDDVWAIGTRTIQSGESFVTAPLAAHWDGTSWTAVFEDGGGSGVVALASDDVWAVGIFGIVHWNGADWEPVASPDVGIANILYDVDAAAADDLWAAGVYFDETGALLTLIEQAPSDTQGSVTGATGFAGALVTWTGPVSGTVETDSFGIYTAAGLPAGDYTFIASAASCQPAVASVTVIAGTTVVQDLFVTC